MSENLPAKTVEGEVLTAANPPKTIEELFTSKHIVAAIQKAAPKHLDAERFLRIANTAMSRTPKLKNCTIMSIWNCMVQLSGMGLEPDGRRAHLIPYGQECTLIVDYKGLVDCVRRSGEVSDVHADIVCDNDEFEESMGKVTKHKINRREPRGDMYAAYSYVKFKDGTESFEIMGKSEIEATRDESAAWKAWLSKKKKCPWNNHPGEMWKKTVFRRHSKWLPFSSELRTVIETDDQYQFPRIAQESISGDEIKGMADGSRRKLSAPPIEEAETEDPPPPVEEKKPIVPVISPAQVKKFWAVAGSNDWPKDDVHAMLKKDHGIESVNDIPAALFNDILVVLEK
jgi:recombination protein RecT